MSLYSTPTAPSVLPVRRQVENGLREAIKAGQFRPGDHLSDRILCEMFRASRPVVREAVRLLEAEGLITFIPNRGPFVAFLSAAEARQLYEIRGVLEALAAEGFAERASEAERAELRRSFDEYVAQGAKGALGDLIEIKKEFYQILTQGCRNAYISRVLEPLLDRIGQLRATSLSHRGRYKDTVVELRKIIDAIERRDPEGAYQACRDHVQQAAAVALRILNERERATRST
jgi:DNA-binding GntR family transcriptional regulator